MTDRPLAMLVPCVSPYHHARFAAAARELRIHAVEFATTEREYAWKRATHGGEYPRTVLFPDEDAADIHRDRLAPRLRSTLDDIAPGSVAIPGWHESAALQGMRWCARAAVPMIMMSDSSERDQPRTAWKEAVKSRLVRMCAAGFVAGAPHGGYLRKLGMEAERIFTGYDAVDNAHFGKGAAAASAAADEHRHRLRLPPSYLLANGRFIARKNHRTLLRAFAAYRSIGAPKDWSLVIVGDGPLRSEIESERDRLGLTDRVLLPGIVAYDDLPAYYALADAFVHPSLIEQWGLVVNEAMASRIPVLISATCGCAQDLVITGVTGWTFEPGDAEGLTRLMVAAASADLRRMGAEAASRIADWGLEAYAHSLAAADAAARAKPRSLSPIDRALLRLMAR